MSDLPEWAWGERDQPQCVHLAAQPRSQLASSLHLSTHARRQSARDTGATVGVACAVGVAFAGGIAAEAEDSMLGVAAVAAGGAAAVADDGKLGVAEPTVADVGTGVVAVTVGVRGAGWVAGGTAACLSTSPASAVPTAVWC
jgi:hypothetical protein